ncbi:MULTISPECIES: type I-E CRISPR-associated protein Cse2/CasB [Bacteria]|uniref:type I-E CRISPR-associated protein Cse2/CasB n=1 Tax=Bacteria TaxID=2 RepID=UPI003C7E91F0
MAEFVDQQVSTLQAQYQANVASAVSALARLRQGVGRAPGGDLELLGIAFQPLRSGASDGGSLYDLLELRGDEVSPEEKAAYAAITLFALHQQSRRDMSMHRRGYSFGQAARLLGHHNGASDAVRRRFTALGTATTWEESVHHARTLIQQFRQHRVQLDYGGFARDLLDLHSPRADRVRARWGRDYFRIGDAGGEKPESHDGGAASAPTTED